MDMTTITFDTHEFFNELKSAGFSEQQAEVITKLQKAAVASTLEQSRIDYDLDNLVTNQAMNTQFRELELRLDAKISDIKYDMVKWIAGMMLAQAGVIAALVKLL
jgi:uncharacterized protein (UPF0335 family)